MIPLYKKEDQRVFGNYRPISLLSSGSKIFEKVAFKQISEYFTCNNLPFNSQWGIRENQSTELAALEFADRIKLEMDRKKIPFSIVPGPVKSVWYAKPRHFINETSVSRHWRRSLKLVPKLFDQTYTVRPAQWYFVIYKRNRNGCPTGINFRPPSLYHIHEWYSHCEPKIYFYIVCWWHNID